MKNSLLVLLATALATQAAAQDYPTRPVRVVIPFAAGGVSDLILRTFSEPLSKTLGQSIVSDNRGGAGGTLAAEHVARSAPDGYTLMLGNGGNLAIAPSLYQALPYDPQRDFAPVAMVTRAQLVLVVHPVLPVSSVKDLVQLAKSKPGQLTYASSGVGAGPHLAAEMLKSFTGLNVVHVPYKGSAPMLASLMGGEVDMAFDAISTSLPHIRSGRLKGLAISGDVRSSLMPDLPTVMESGVPKFNYASFFALVAPAGTPSSITGRLSREIVRICETADVRKRLENLGLNPVPLAAAELDALLRKERTFWAGLIKSAQIKVE